MILPRPDLQSIGINYRRIPVLAIGKDIYCDTSAIIDALNTKFSDKLVLSSKDLAGAIKGLQVLADGIFRVVLGAFRINRMPPSFIEDRKDLFPLLIDPNFEQLRPHALSETRGYLTTLENNLHSDWILGQDLSLGDIEIIWVLRWALLDLKFSEEPSLSKEQFPKVYTWIDRFMVQVEKNKSPSIQIKGDEAKRIILASNLDPVSGVDSNDPLLLKEGDQVVINSTDAKPTHPQEGKLIGLNGKETVIELDNGIHVHFPRIGYRVEKIVK
ncbi:unnamed protein product [Didymodactylos carnosus]|uniref:DUF7962 domain-containing protein n=1 Tax=Didymodactylos carnosus TaxID=1234261 RepID=A0A815FZ32_9BILA|nr:unnamed protein product [Didymodactylos carnosus]CAF1331882.1 unnamed protein product [Didymodactylos carnosus]CAF3752256.1 unnamed protein product [Didymodactylos carnosus]CAF4185942.1 unnamed protein product [Didymodactylos carnosus]